MQESFPQNIDLYLEEFLNHNQNYEKLFEDLKNQLTNQEYACALAHIVSNKDDVKLLNCAIRQINKTRFKDNIPCLIDFIMRNSGDNAVFDLKVLAIKTLSNFKDTSCVSVLLYCLNDKNSNYKIRLAAAEALGKIGDKNAFEPLSNVVCDEKENSAYIKESAVTALGMLGDERALDVFDTILNTKQMFLGKFSYLKERIVEAISKFDISKDARALKILKKSLLDPSSRLRITAIEALSNSDFDCAWDLIKDRLEADDDIEVRRNALVALYNMSSRKILDEVAKGEYPAELRAYAIEIIEEYEEGDE